MIGTASNSSIHGISLRTRSTSPPEQSRIGGPPSVSRQPFSSALLPWMICARSPVR